MLSRWLLAVALCLLGLALVLAEDAIETQDEDAGWVAIKVNKMPVPVEGTEAAAEEDAPRAAFNYRDYFPSVATAQRQPLAFALPAAWTEPTEEVEASVATATIDAFLAHPCVTHNTVEYVYTVCPFRNATQEQLEGDLKVVLGVWGHWDTESNNWAMQFTDGNPCSDGNNRKSVITFHCDSSLETPILQNDVSESECTYYFRISSPFVCGTQFRFEETNRAIVWPTRAEGEESTWTLNTEAPSSDAAAATPQMPQVNCDDCCETQDCCAALTEAHDTTVTAMQACITALTTGDTENTQELCENFI